MPEMAIFMLPVFYIILKNKVPITELESQGARRESTKELELKINYQFRKHSYS